MKSFYEEMLKTMTGIIEGKQMPRHLICDAHEWNNEIPTVPTYFLAKLQLRERA